VLLLQGGSLHDSELIQNGWCVLLPITVLAFSYSPPQRKREHRPLGPHGVDGEYHVSLRELTFTPHLEAVLVPFRHAAGAALSTVAKCSGQQRA
jgi:hypothetical protein